MDSQVVAREIKSEIWPVLRRAGFDKFSPKTAWRYTPEQIHVVNFQSFNSHLAEGVGYTTFRGSRAKRCAAAPLCASPLP
jgi:hypothetical protein